MKPGTAEDGVQLGWLAGHSAFVPQRTASGTAQAVETQRTSPNRK